MAISIDDEMLLEWYFGAVHLSFARSTFGTMLERQEARYRDSEGRRVTRPENPWQCMKVHETRHEASYEPDEEMIYKLVWVSRRIEEIGKRSPMARAALELYYGNEGQHWKPRPQQQSWALVDITKTGAKFYQHRKERAEACGSALAQTAAAELAADAESQNLCPNNERAARIERVKDEIDMIVRVMNSEWAASAPERRPVRATA
jgi:hypothetical protein